LKKRTKKKALFFTIAKIRVVTINSIFENFFSVFEKKNTKFLQKSQNIEKN